MANEYSNNTNLLMSKIDVPYGSVSYLKKSFNRAEEHTETLAVF